MHYYEENLLIQKNIAQFKGEKNLMGKYVFEHSVSFIRQKLMTQL